MTRLQKEEASIAALEAEGMSRSDAQAVYEADQIMKARMRAAKSDLALARKNGAMGVARTTVGFIDVRYDNARYSLCSENGESLLDAPTKTAQEWLAKKYKIVVEGNL